ncbi:TrmH family RNA methyltransferase [Janibacter cremeus]|uniref:TrmH family RNA methyltransferase n=2 Tax=Janibacter cremeus TaxID=1285192 RepID=A0A852VT13_9MICO|nr:TrmH family RNA methyltransferase [Janibacter cremeus]
MLVPAMSDLVITSPANQRLKGLVTLRRRRVRESSGTTLLEGLEETALALDAGVVPRALFHCPELMLDPTAGAALVERARRTGAEVVELGRTAFEKVAYREGPDGILARVPSPGLALADVDLPDDALVLLCEGVEKPGNLGAMLRTADAAGVALVISADPVTDWGNPNVIRSSKGTVFSVPVASASTDEAWTWLTERGVAVVATTPDTDVDHTDADLTGPVAVAVGSEKYGLSDAALARARYRVRIPMVGQANSLNVATSAAIVVYEAVRQRRAA